VGGELSRQDREGGTTTSEGGSEHQQALPSSPRYRGKSRGEWGIFAAKNHLSPRGPPAKTGSAARREGPREDFRFSFPSSRTQPSYGSSLSRRTYAAGARGRTARAIRSEEARDEDAMAKSNVRRQAAAERRRGREKGDAGRRGEIPGAVRVTSPRQKTRVRERAHHRHFVHSPGHNVPYSEKCRVLRTTFIFERAEGLFRRSTMCNDDRIGRVSSVSGQQKKPHHCSFLHHHRAQAESLTSRCSCRPFL
jgi:hypothetical protein